MAKGSGAVTVTVRGIEVTINPAAADDIEFVELIAANADPSATAAERLSAMVGVFKVLFGDDYRRVKTELRAKNGGTLPVNVMSDFATTVMNEAAQLKNSGGSDTSSEGTGRS